MSPFSCPAPRRIVQRFPADRFWSQLVPILMTALTAALALIPLALGRGEPGKEIQAPKAVVVLGGLLSSTFLNMLVVPVLFRQIGGGRKEGGKGQ